MIPQTDPKSGYLAHRQEIDSAIQRVLESGWYILGQEVDAFEQEFAGYFGVGHAIGVANGTDAIELSLRACGVGRGDLVFTVSHTAVATVAAIESTGATPVFIDIDPVTYTIDVAQLETALANPPSGTPRAIVPVHLYGHPSDMPAIMELSRRYSVDVIEDCAQSHGATVDGVMTGAWGRISAFSFYPTKNLGTFGDGGMVATNDAELAEKVRLLQQYGWRERYISEISGRNSRLDELHAAILRVKLRHLETENRRRREIAALYDDLLAGENLTLPVVRPQITHAYHQYAVRSDRREALRSHLREAGIGTLVHYPVPVHMQPAYSSRAGSAGQLPVTEKVAREILSLPMFPQLSDDSVKRVSSSIGRFSRPEMHDG